MKLLTKICIMGTLLLIVLIGLAFAEDLTAQPVPICVQYQVQLLPGFGSKVAPGDADLGAPLSEFAGTQLPVAIGWVDRGPVPFFVDEEDGYYLHFGFPPGVRENDIRLTPWSNHPAGSKVRTTDNDIRVPFGPNPAGPQCGFYFIDMSGTTTGFDFKDLVYLKGTFTAPPPIETITNDIRISDVQQNAGGSKVSDFDVDHNKRLNPLVTLTVGGVFVPALAPLFGPIGRIRFYNANGNVIPGLNLPIYDYPDMVYIDIPNVPIGTPGFVSVNDVRLTIPV